MTDAIRMTKPRFPGKSENKKCVFSGILNRKSDIVIGIIDKSRGKRKLGFNGSSIFSKCAVDHAHVMASQPNKAITPTRFINLVL